MHQDDVVLQKILPYRQWQTAEAAFAAESELGTSQSAACAGSAPVPATAAVVCAFAVAGAALILFVILSYFKQDVYLKNVGTVFALAIISTVGLEIINTLSQSFS